MTTNVEPSPAGGVHLSDAKLDIFSSSMARLLMLWIVLVGVASFVTVPWLSHTQLPYSTDSGDFTATQTWFYHALMLPSALLFLILCTRVFTTHNWVRYVVSHSALVAMLEGVGFMILGYGTEYHMTSLVDFGYWIVMPCTIELFAVTALFVGDLAAASFWPPRGARMQGQEAEIHWALFFAGVSVLTFVAFGVAEAASVVGVSWDFWARAQGETSGALTSSIIEAHSRGLLPSFMAGIVFLAAEAFGYSKLAGPRKQAARGAVGIMLGGIALYSGIYTVSALGTFVIPRWFPYGAGGVNGLPMDYAFSGLVGLGALILAGVMTPEIWGSFQKVAGAVRERFNPVRLAVYMSYLMAALVVFIYGYYIDLNETYFGSGAQPATGAINDQLFTRTHLLLAFGSLPIIAVFLVAAELLGSTWKLGATFRHFVSGSVITGMVVSTLGMGAWAFATPAHANNWSLTAWGAILYMAGQGLILLGGAVELFTVGPPPPLPTGAAAAEVPLAYPPALAPEGRQEA
jgi:hypothetical protein